MGRSEACLSLVGENPNTSGGLDGSFITHEPVFEKFADIPNAFWVRGMGTKVYVFTKDLGVYEYDVETGNVAERFARRDKEEIYVFAAVDETGSIGPVGRIYAGAPSQKNGGFLSSKVDMFWIEPSDWSSGTFNRQNVINRSDYNGFGGPSLKPPNEAEIKRFCSQFSSYWNPLSF